MHEEPEFVETATLILMNNLCLGQRLTIVKCITVFA